MWRNVMMLMCACVCFVACGEAQDEQVSPEVALDEAFVAGAAPAGKADEPTLALTLITQVTPPEAVRVEARRRVITTPAAFTQLFRQAPPEGFDFGAQWMVFYAAGRQPTAGHEAHIAQVRLSSTGKSLQVITSHSAPGAGCAQDSAETTPWTLAAFARPAIAAQSVRYYAQDEVRACGDGPSVCDEAALQGALEDIARDLWFMSEGDEPVHAQVWGGAATAQLPVEADLLSLWQEPNVEGVFEDGGESAAVSAMAQVWEMDVARFTASVYSMASGEPVMLDEAAQQALAAQLTATLGAQVRVIKVVTVYEADGGWSRAYARVNVYVVGQTACGAAGLHAVSIET